MKQQQKIKVIVHNLDLCQSLACVIGAQTSDNGAFDITMLVRHLLLCTPNHGLVPLIRLVCSVNSKPVSWNDFNMLICLYFPNILYIL